MNTDHTPLHTRPRRALPPLMLLTLLSAALLPACGGDSGEADVQQTDTAAHVQVVSALLDDEGRVMPSDPAAVPADPGAKTRAGHYATAAQAEQLERAMTNAAMSTQVDSGFDAATAADLAVLTVYGLQAAHDLDPHAPVLVRGADLRLGAAFVNRLQDNGFTRVFLVTP